VARLEKAFLLVTAAEDVFRRMRAAHLHDTDAAIKQGVITPVEAEQYKAAHEAVLRVIEVDDFAPEALSPLKKAIGMQIVQERSESRAAG